MAEDGKLNTSTSSTVTSTLTEGELFAEPKPTFSFGEQGNMLVVYIEAFDYVNFKEA